MNVLRALTGSVWFAIALWASLDWPAGGLSPLRGGEQPKAMPRANSTPVFRPLPAKAVGVVILQPEAVLAEERRHGPAGGAACFSSGGSSYQWFYVPAKPPSAGEAQKFTTGGKGAKRVEISYLTIATPRRLEAFGITKPYTLVEVTVNGAEGSAPEESFAATEIKVLEGTGQYGLRVAEIVRGCEAKCRTKLTQEDTVAAEMEKARAEAAKDAAGTAGKEVKKSSENRVYVTWMPEKERLRVVCHTRLVEEIPLFGKGTTSAGVDGSSGEQDASGKGPAGRNKSYGPQWGLDAGVAFEFSKQGEEISSELIDPKRFIRKMGPPPPRAER